MEPLFKRFLKIVYKRPSGSTLIDLFEEQVISNPDRLALVYKNEKLSYKELNEKSNQLAYYLRSRGVKEEALVPVFLDRSVEMIIAILGILKAGGAFVPIDPGYPVQRIQFILGDIGDCSLVTTNEGKAKLLNITNALALISLDGDSTAISRMATKNLPNRPASGHLAYVIYTSGSTGTPKGVMIEHKSIFNYLLVSRDKFIKKGENSSGTFIHIPYTFDASLKSIFTPLVSGKLAVISSEPSPLVFEDANLHKFAPYDFIQLTPAHLEFFYAAFYDRFNRLITGKISIGGEALYLSHFDFLAGRRSELEVVNEYGPTEATVACTNYTFHASRPAGVPENIPIGKPVENVKIYILDQELNPVKTGQPGEIYVAGAQVARGYLNQPELTSKKFIKNPVSNARNSRLYATGDIGRWLPDGNIEYVGRVDNQVKIRGHRIELGEIESVLATCKLVKSAVIESSENNQGDKQLVAYIVPWGVFDKQAVLAYLKARLPYHMIPEKLVELGSLPITANGKIDRRSLTGQL